MKRLFVVMLSMAVLSSLSGCATYRSMRGQDVGARQMPVQLQMPMPAEQQMQSDLVDANGAPIEKVAFRAGISTVTVENMAKQASCWGTQGAGLVTPPGPVEIYRLVCDNGAVFMAKCELRQCKRMAVTTRTQ